MAKKEELKMPVKNYHNSPLIGDCGLNLDEGDNARFMKVNMTLFNMSKVDMHDEHAVMNRLGEYFALYTENDMKPTVAGMAMALGMDRRRLWEIKTGNFGNTRGLQNLPPAVTDGVKKAYVLMENMWESYMNSGKINPVSGIFLGKNNFGYQDKQEYVVTPNQQQESDYDADEIRQRYLKKGE